MTYAQFAAHANKYGMAKAIQAALHQGVTLEGSSLFLRRYMEAT